MLTEIPMPSVWWMYLKSTQMWFYCWLSWWNWRRFPNMWYTARFRETNTWTVERWLWCFISFCYQTRTQPDKRSNGSSNRCSKRS